MESYDKLVRDNIPDIILANGENPVVEILEKEDLKRELIKKLLEESKEIEKAQENKEELVKEISDVQEVLSAIIENFDLDPIEIAKIKAERKIKRGGFAKGIFLKTVNK
ncbi:MAG: nucleoside triphosphate pyrophosphohydrolase [Candidatus Paceibacterota bacterium]